MSVREFETSPLHATAEVGDLLLKPEQLAGINRAADGKLHDIHPRSRTYPRERARWARRASGDLSRASDAGVSVGSQCSRRTELRDHAADLTCASKASVGRLRRVTIAH